MVGNVEMIEAFKRHTVDSQVNSLITLIGIKLQFLRSSENTIIFLQN